MVEVIKKLGDIRAGRVSVAVVTTGGTIAKSYDPSEARLHNYEPKIKDLIAELRTDDLELTFLDLMQLDSLEIGNQERDQIVEYVSQLVDMYDAILVTHGTDSMSATAEALCSSVISLNIPVIFTGAMIPYSVKGSDALQNVTEALLALRLLPAGVYIAFHNRVLSLPGVRKDYENLTFAKG
ncbi:MAG: asparaginase [Gammaproteobacteria bacterium]|nr:asparaginase [Gammaproteobacteria bacterium]